LLENKGRVTRRKKYNIKIDLKERDGKMLNRFADLRWDSVVSSWERGNGKLVSKQPRSLFNRMTAPWSFV
jgi:hypothetical protein